jgi:hypothetical protein
MMIEALETWFADEENKLCVLYKARKLLIPPRITWVPRFLKTAFAFKIFQGYLDRFRRDITDFFPQVHNCDETSPLHITKETILKTMEAY